MRLVDLTGQKFGRLTVIKREQNDKTNHTRWKCQCNCGNIIVVSGSSLRTGETKSCGCLRKEKVIKRSLKHSMSSTRIYYIWKAMKQRCYNVKHVEYFNYGGRGIKVCNEWLDKGNGFSNFYNWAIENGYKEDLSIDRINVNGNYEPNNCKWIPFKNQCENKTTSHYISYNGQTHTMKQWSVILNINYDKIRQRIKHNIPKELWFYKGRINKKIKQKYIKGGTISVRN